MFCNNCGAHIDDGASFCTNCGAPVNPNEPLTQETLRDGDVCPSCGAPVQPGADFCTQCGASLRPDQPTGNGTTNTQTQTQTWNTPYASPTETPIPSPPPMDPPQPKRKAGMSGGTKVALVCLVVVAVVAAGVVGMWLTGMGPFDTERTLPIPAALSDTDSTTSDDSTGTDDTSGSGSTTSSTTDTTTQSVSVPDVRGMTQADATRRIQAAGLTVGTVTDDYSDTVTAGNVISQSVSAGSSVSPGKSVGLVVSKGPRQQEQSHAQSHTYTLVQQAMTWNDANAYCAAHGGHLATITSSEEYQKVLGTLSGSDVRVCWLGGYRDGDSWRWVTGEDFSYTDWAINGDKREPNNEGGNENCLALLKNSSDNWGWYDCPNDVSGVYKAKYLGFVMEQDD